MRPETKKKFIDCFSGLLGGAVSVTVCSPLDITRTRLNIMASVSLPVLTSELYLLEDDIQGLPGRDLQDFQGRRAQGLL